MTKVYASVVPILLKTVLPSILGAAGVIAAALYSDGFRAFCGFN